MSKLKLVKVLSCSLASMLAIVSLNCGGGGGGGGGSPTAPPVPRIASNLSVTIGMYPHTPTPTDVSLKLDGSVIARLVLSTGCTYSWDIPLCPNFGGSVQDLEPGSTHTLSFEVNAQTRPSIKYDLVLVGLFQVPSRNLTQDIRDLDRTVTLRSGQSTSWTITLAQ